MKRILGTAGAIGLAFILVLVAYRNYKASLYAGLSTDKIADIDTISIVMLFIGIGLVVTIMIIVWAIRQSKHDDYFPSAPPHQSIEADYRFLDLPSYRPPTPLPPTPRVITVPRYSHNGKTTPYGLNQPIAPIQLRTTTQDETTGTSIELSVPLPALMRFIALATPSRSEWTGKRELYGDCAAFCSCHGLLNKQTNGGWKWKPQYPLEARKQWVLQFEQADDNSSA